MSSLLTEFMPTLTELGESSFQLGNAAVECRLLRCHEGKIRRGGRRRVRGGGGGGGGGFHFVLILSSKPRELTSLIKLYTR